MAALVRSIADAIVGKTLDGVITDWNPAAERLYGYAADEIVGKSITILSPPELPHEIDAFLNRVRRGESVEGFQTVRCTKDGHLIPVSVTISLIRDDAGRIVAASGIGIAPEALPYIFDEFRQADSRLSRRHGGAGLGLAIAKKLADQMGGCIVVESQVGVGSAFILRLPVAASPGSAPDAHPAADGQA